MVMRLLTYLGLLSTAAVTRSLVSSSPQDLARRDSWPNGTFTTSGKWIVDANGANFIYAGVNWPGASETMLPEGLQYQSIESIVSKIKNLSMNSIRLTYATELINQIYDNRGTDVSIQKAFVDSLGQENGTAVFDKVIANNPSFTSNTTRLQVFDAIVAECAKQQIYVHLDNHISKGMWCCNINDGNAWWDDKYFSPANWTRGLSYMANHGKAWPNLISMSLYNELRPPLSGNSTLLDTYTWETWYTNVKAGADAIHEANPDLLIFLSGLDGDMDLSPVVQGTDLEPSTARFNRGDFAGYGNDKLVLELHSYNIVATVRNCPEYNTDQLEAGFQAMAGNTTNPFPVVMTEWGFELTATSWKEDTYAVCVQKFLGEQKAGWMVWEIGGSYYVRQGMQDFDETWGLLTHDWSEWRSPEFIEGGLKPLVQLSLSSTNEMSSGEGSANSTNSTGSSPVSGVQSAYRGGRRILYDMAVICGLNYLVQQIWMVL